MEGRDRPDGEYLPLLSTDAGSPPASATRPSRRLAVAATTIVLAAAVLAIVSTLAPLDTADSAGPGVSLKSGGPEVAGVAYPWTNALLSWQRTAYHFQPQQNWMNDPDGPLYYKGWYHLFFQYNPDSAVWGNITWGHAVSKDLIHWLYLPIAMVPDQWYDINGVWTGSATQLPDGEIKILYTGSTNESVQVQCLATPSDPTDPLLLHWLKSDSNPVLLPPPGVGLKDFRDPTTAWFSANDSSWRIAVGSKDSSHAGVALVFKTTDFVDFELLPGVMHRVPEVGMWECIDFYPVSTTSADGVDTSVDIPNTAGVKHVLKASMDDDRHDYYALGTYDLAGNRWTPDDASVDVGVGLRYDYGGVFYASKTFYDKNSKRRILWGWINEADSNVTDIKKGWASVQTVPRTVQLDGKTGKNLLQWPVAEVESLRSSNKSFDGVELKPGAVMPLPMGLTSQLDIVAEFAIDPSAVELANASDGPASCDPTLGAAARGALGPFGFLVLADMNLIERTAVYFYVTKKADGGLDTVFCVDELRSSVAEDVKKKVYGGAVTVLQGEGLSLRILVDHSIVESFAQGGRTVVTSRVYPTVAVNEAAPQVYIFNNATDAFVTGNVVTLYQMDSADIRPYPGLL